MTQHHLSPHGRKGAVALGFAMTLIVAGCSTGDAEDAPSAQPSIEHTSRAAAGTAPVDHVRSSRCAAR